MAMLRLPTGVCPADRTRPLIRMAVRITLFLLLAGWSGAAHLASATPTLWLPTPPGETWKILQGYQCGTHTHEDQYALDLANSKGRTYGAPVRAATSGTVWYWGGGSGTLILSHGGGFYTQYTHMQKAYVSAKGTEVKRGQVIGEVGDRGSPGVPHLHFMAFTGKGVSASGRRSMPLSFAEGYSFPVVGGCNQHGGKTVVADGDAVPVAVDTGMQVATSMEANHWYSADQAIAISGGGVAGGYSIAWDGEPAADKPQIAAATGTVQLAAGSEGLHTLSVRGWAADGTQTVVKIGPFGYDVTPPSMPGLVSASDSSAAYSLAADAPGVLEWQSARDEASGVAGYRVYLGPDEQGTSDWFTEQPTVSTPKLAAGSYLLRVQPIDYAGNVGAWTTLGAVESK